MTLLSIVIVLAVIGFIMWVVNTQAGQFIDPKFLKLINIVVFVITIIWLLNLFFPGILGSANQVRVPR